MSEGSQFESSSEEPRIAQAYPIRESRTLVSRIYYVPNGQTGTGAYRAEKLFGPLRDYSGGYHIFGRFPQGVRVVAWVDKEHDGMFPNTI